MVTKMKVKKQKKDDPLARLRWEDHMNFKDLTPEEKKATIKAFEKAGAKRVKKVK